VKSQPDWRAAARAARLPIGCFIGGALAEAEGGARYQNIDPARGAALCEVAAGTAADIDRAVSCARRAFERGPWRRMLPRQRGQILIRLAELVDRHADELALLETLDIGKPIRYTTRVDLRQAELTLRWFGEAADKIYDHQAPAGGDVVALISREPVGVVGAITPWNFPMMIAAWKLAPALVAGNSVVLKPAEQSPLTALRLAELALEAGVPDGVLNVVPGLGEVAGKALALHADVDAVAFTGSTEVGKLLLEYAGQSNMKRVSLETGGKTPNILFADAPDLDHALRAVGFSVFWNSGQMCVAGSRLLVERSIYHQVVGRLAVVADDWQPGEPLDPASKAGPVIDQAQLDRILEHIELARAAGGRLLTGGHRVLPETGGYYVAPTIFTDVDPASPLAREEVFGPVLAVIPFDGEDEAVRIAEDTRYGLSAALWTSNLARAHRVARAINAGTVWVNNFDQADMTAPFGGTKQSGFGGKDKSLWAIDKYTSLKTTWINIGKGGR
jgi:acyl-CoA reductase-like NAD-dependent aldehyde dehydrogenase